MTHVLFYFFLGLSRENGAWEGSFTAFKSISVPWVRWPLLRKVHIYLMCLTPLFSAQFYQTMISTQRYVTEAQLRHGSFTHSLHGQCRNRHTTISILETRAICSNPKGAEMRKSSPLALLFFLPPLLSAALSFFTLPSLCLIGTAVQREEMKRVIEREVGIQYKAHGGMQESEGWKTKRARGEETTGWES